MPSNNQSNIAAVSGAAQESGRWTFEVTATIQVTLDAEAEMDRRMGDDGEIRRAAIADIDVHGIDFTETSVVGWWPTDA
jgi:hypothetical protein